MVGNVVGLYSYSAVGNAVVPSNNNTGLYNDAGGYIPVSDNINISGNINAGGYIFANGNIVTNSYFVGDGSQLSNISAGNITGLYGNANVEAYLASGTNTGNIITVGNVSGAYILGDGSQLTNLPQSYSNANVAAYLPVYTGNIRAGNLSVVGNTVTGNLRTTGAAGNITGANYVVGNFFVGDGSLLTNLPGSTYSNANVAAFLASGNLTSNIITTATVQANIYKSDSYYDSNFNITSAMVVDTVDVGNGLGNVYAVTMNGIDGDTGNVRTRAQLTPFGLSTEEIDSVTGNVTGYVSIGEGGTLAIGTDDQAGNTAVLTVVAFNGGLEMNLSGGGNTTTLTPVGISTPGNIEASGNISAAYFLGDGSQLTGLPATYSNAEVATFLADFGSNTISTTGNITAGFFIGNGSQLSGLPASYSNANVATYLASGTISTNIITTANVSANNIATTGNVSVGGSLLSDDITSTGDVTIYGNQVITGNLTVQGNTTTINSNVITTNDKTITVANNQSTGANVNGAGLEAGNPAIATWYYNDATTSWQSNIGITPTSNGVVSLGTNTNRWATIFGTGANIAGNVTATGNIQGNYILGNGSQLSGLPATYSNANVATFLAAYGSNTISSTGNITTTANIAGGYFIGNGSQLTGIVSSYSNSNVSSFLAAYGANTISSTGNITTTANIAGGYFIGNGSQLTGIISSYGNSNVTALLANLGTNVISSIANISTMANISAGNYTGTIRTAAQPNITSLGTLTGLNVNATVSTDIVLTVNKSGGNIGNIVIEGTSGNGNINLNPGGSSGVKFINLNSPTVTQGTASATGTITGGNLATAGTVSATGNITSAGNISGSYILGNGSQLTGITGNYSNSNVASFLSAYGANTISSTGNITTTANIAGGFFIGNGSALTGITGNYSNSNVTALLASLGANAISSTANITTTANVSANSITTLTYGKIQGDFSSAVNTGRTLFQTTNTSTTSPTFISAIPGANNTSVNGGGFGAFGNADSGNTSFIVTQITSTDGRVNVNKNGTGTFLPFTIYTSAAEKVRVDTSGNVGVANTAPVDKLSVNGTGYFSSNVAVGGLLTNNYYYANGTPISFAGTYSDSNVTSLLASLGSNIISSTANITTTGNVSGGNLLGIGSGITGINAFGNVAVAGQTTVSADNTTDTLTLVAGTNITITTDAPNNKITITSTASGGETLSPFLLMGG
jgi:hypothetical protein